MTEKKLKTLFDYQRYQRNPRLAKIIAEAREDVGAGHAIGDDALAQVSAAGEAERPQKLNFLEGEKRNAGKENES